MVFGQESTSAVSLADNDSQPLWGTPLALKSTLKVNPDAEVNPVRHKTKDF